MSKTPERAVTVLATEEACSDRDDGVIFVPAAVLAVLEGSARDTSRMQAIRGVD